jgi:hypothetical protein
MILRGDRNQCPTCSQYFNSTRAFEKHRVGDWSVRRCLTPDEMTTKKMLKNKTGFWITKEMPREALP